MWTGSAGCAAVLLSQLLSTLDWTSLSYMCRVSLVRMTGPLEQVLGAFLADPAAAWYGYDLMKAARLQSGTLYPLLARLEHQNLVASAWETPKQEGQQPRKYYQLTAEGIRVARLELAQSSARRPRAPARPGRPVPGSLG
jgi:PadR family transcriptional regulator, regulatory protein PadR